MGVTFGDNQFVAVGVGEIVYSMCDQPAAAADVLNNQKFLQGPGESRKAQSAGRKANFLSDMGLLSPRSYPRPYALGPRPPLHLTSPNGDETLQAGEKFLITWKSNREIEKVKLEYSPDNGTTYLPIAVDVANSGHYEWGEFWAFNFLFTAYFLLRIVDLIFFFIYAIYGG